MRNAVVADVLLGAFVLVLCTDAWGWHKSESNEDEAVAVAMSGDNQYVYVAGKHTVVKLKEQSGRKEWGSVFPRGARALAVYRITEPQPKDYVVAVGGRAFTVMMFDGDTGAACWNHPYRIPERMFDEANPAFTRFSSGIQDGAYAVALDNDGAVFAAGQAPVGPSSDPSDSKYVVVKLPAPDPELGPCPGGDPPGDEWTAELPALPRSLAVFSNGDVVAAGIGFAVKLAGEKDPDGNVVERWCSGCICSGCTQCTACGQADTCARLEMSGRTVALDGQENVIAAGGVKLDGTTGNCVWDVTGVGTAAAAVYTNGGNPSESAVFSVGSRYVDRDRRSFLITRLDNANGEVEWMCEIDRDQKRGYCSLPGPPPDCTFPDGFNEALAVTVDGSGNVVAVGRTEVADPECNPDCSPPSQEACDPEPPCDPHCSRDWDLTAVRLHMDGSWDQRYDRDGGTNEKNPSAVRTEEFRAVVTYGTEGHVVGAGRVGSSGANMQFHVIRLDGETFDQ
jgi:hypothetical protein